MPKALKCSDRPYLAIHTLNTPKNTGYLDGQADLVSRSINSASHIVSLVIPIIPVTLQVW